MIITIGRECGCGADEIGKFLAEKYQIPFYARKQLEQLAKEKGIYDRYPFFFGEIPADTMLHSLSEEIEEQVRKVPKEVFSQLLQNQDCVIVGRASNYALQDCEDVISLFFSGTKAARIEKIAHSHGITKKKAKMIVEETDCRRCNYHQYYSGQVWGYAGNYDMCLDAIHLGKEGIANMVDAYYRQKKIN